MEDMLLPIGSVVTLKNGSKKLMVIAFCVSSKQNSNEIYDYCGVLYPEGMVDSSRHFFFNNENIEKIHYLGYFNEEEEAFKGFLYQILCVHTKKELPWGNMTGIRPTKIAMTLLSEGKKQEENLKNKNFFKGKTENFL